MERSGIDVWSSFKFNNETDFEKIILQSNLFKNFDIYDAKITLNKTFNRYPDIVLFQKQRKYWCIGEVEIAEHSFESHVFPQVIEIYTLIERNLDFIQRQFLNHPAINNDKALIELVSYNKPFVSLISDRFPPKHINSLSILKNICNVSVVSRFKDSNENYIYNINEYPMNEVKKLCTSCLIDENLLFIERPNIISMHILNHKSLVYEGEEIFLKSYNEVPEGQKRKRLFWFLEKPLRKGKYNLSLLDNILTLSKS